MAGWPSYHCMISGKARMTKIFFVTTTLLFQFFTGIKGLKVLIHSFIHKSKDCSKPHNDHHNNDKKKKKREEGT